VRAERERPARAHGRVGVEVARPPRREGPELGQLARRRRPRVAHDERRDEPGVADVVLDVRVLHVRDAGGGGRHGRPRPPPGLAADQDVGARPGVERERAERPRRARTDRHAVLREQPPLAAPGRPREEPVEGPGAEHAEAVPPARVEPDDRFGPAVHEERRARRALDARGDVPVEAPPERPGRRVVVGPLHPGDVELGLEGQEEDMEGHLGHGREVVPEVVGAIHKNQAAHAAGRLDGGRAVPVGVEEAEARRRVVGRKGDAKRAAGARFNSLRHQRAAVQGLRDDAVEVEGRRVQLLKVAVAALVVVDRR
jgi:hypothetical protein